MFYPHLSESGRRRRPALVQDVLGQVPAQRHEEGVAHVIQEILVLRTALLVAVDETFDEPEDLNQRKLKALQNLSNHSHFKTTVSQCIVPPAGLSLYWCVPADGISSLSPALSPPPGQDPSPPRLDGNSCKGRDIQLQHTKKTLT